MSNVELQKLNAAQHAAEIFLRPGQIVGLGGGSTVRKFIDVMAEINAKNICVIADEKNKGYAKRRKIKIMSLASAKRIDIAFDGADGIDRQFNLIKGAGGGAVSHEKIIDTTAKKVVIIADSTKLKKDLLKMDVPIEVMFDAADYVISHLRNLGAAAKVKKAFLTDHGNYILNARFKRKYPLAKLEKMVKEIPGVIESGIFTDVADNVVIGYDNHAEVLR